MALAVQYSTRFDSVELVQAGATTTLVCRTYRAGALATPSSGTFTLLDSYGTAVVSAQAVTIASGVATFTVLGSVTSALTKGDGWRVVWSLVMPDTCTHTFECAAALCRSVPAVPITEAAIYARVPSLDASRPGAIATRQEYSSTIDDCWGQLRELLLERANRVELIVTAAQLREPLLLLVLAQIFEDLAPQSQGTNYLDQAATYRTQFASKWANTAFSYDVNDDGLVDTARGARGPIWAM